MVNGVRISEELPRATCCVISQIRFCDAICLALKKMLSVDAEPFGGILYAPKQGPLSGLCLGPSWMCLDSHHPAVMQLFMRLCAHHC